MSNTNIVVVRVETTVCKDFATDKAALKWIEKRKDYGDPNVKYELWHSPTPVPEVTK